MELPDRLREDANIMRHKGGFPTVAAELEEAASEINRLRAVLWSIGHAAGVETKEHLMKAAREALEKSR